MSALADGVPSRPVGVCGSGVSPPFVSLSYSFILLFVLFVHVSTFPVWRSPDEAFAVN